MWLVQPITQKEESMHSLLMRLSAGNDISIQAARSILFATDKKQDLDKISTFHASMVADAANLSEKQAQSITCRKWNGKLIADMDSGRNNFDWLPCSSLSYKVKPKMKTCPSHTLAAYPAYKKADYLTLESRTV